MGAANPKLVLLEQQMPASHWWPTGRISKCGICKPVVAVDRPIRPMPNRLELMSDDGFNFSFAYLKFHFFSPTFTYLSLINQSLIAFY